ncbi:MAG: EamA family transporter, partial [Spirochaetales bacterium]|nr:EamA family transporter [Spirochaetales bacterium]
TVFFSLTLTGCMVTALLANIIGISLNLVAFELPRYFFIFIVVDSLLLATSFTCLAFAYKYGDMSVVFPVWRLFPIFVSLFGWLILGENISNPALVGIVISVLGAYIIGLPKLSFGALAKPFQTRDRAFLLALIAALCSTTSFLLQKSIVPGMSPLVYNVFLQGLGALWMVLLNRAVLVKREYVSRVRTEWAANKRAIVVVSFIGPLTLLFTLYAFSYVPASFAAAFSQISVVLGTLTGVFILKERDRTPVKLTSSLLICAGLAIIVAVR